jgi:hypothetical protein
MKKNVFTFLLIAATVPAILSCGQTSSSASSEASSVREVFEGRSSLVLAKEQAQAALKEDRVVETFSGDPTGLLLYSSYLQNLSEYALTEGFSKSVSKATQKTSSGTRYLTRIKNGSRRFYQNYDLTSSAVLLAHSTSSVANRFYAEGGKIEAYLAKDPSEWKKFTEEDKNTWTEDDYIQKYGKLFFDQYFVKDTSSRVHDGYFSDSYEEYVMNYQEHTFRTVDGLFSPSVDRSTLSDVSLEKSKSGYVLTCTLSADEAFYYEKVRKAADEAFAEGSVRYESSTLTFTFDEELYPVKAAEKNVFVGERNLSVVPSLDVVHEETEYRYFHSDKEDGFTDKDGKTFSLTIPEPDDNEDIYTENKAVEFDLTK